MKTQWMIYKELEQIPDSVSQPIANRLNIAAWLSGIWRSLSSALVSEAKPQFWESLDRARTEWNFDDPVSGQFTCLSSEDAIRAWLELRYYHRNVIVNNPPESRLGTIMTVNYFTLHNGEVLKLPRDCRRLRVLSGVAWVAVARQDLVLSWGQEALLPPAKNAATVSALGKTPVVLEVQGKVA